MQDGFRRDWIIQYLEGKFSKEHRRAYNEGRKDIINGRTPTDEGLFAYSIPKIITYAQTAEEENIMVFVDELVSDEDARIAGWGLDVKLPSDSRSFSSDDIDKEMREEETEGNNDGNFIQIGRICQTYEEFLEEVG